MNDKTMAHFICEQRKAKNLTQKQLAEQLHVTDKAVSKWERGMGYPDITMLAKLAEALGVTTNELLSGCRDENTGPKDTDVVENALQYAEKVTLTNSKKSQSIIRLIIDVLAALSIMVCVICDLAVTGALTWSLYPVVSIVFAWLITLPLFVCKRHKIEISLASLSVFVIPFLFCIESLSKTSGWMLPLGMPITAASIVCLWLVFYLFKKLHNKWYASGSTQIIALGLSAVINFIVARFTAGPFWDIWDAVSLGTAVLLAVILFAVGRFKTPT